MDVTYSHLTRVTASPREDTWPAWSPDGTRLAFVSLRDFNVEIYVANADGSGETRLTDDPALNRGPAWSPDATRIAFESFREGKSEVYVVNADGSGLTPLTNGSSE
jgi:Tol biopolymer transport system component